jgi:hypothetical protein
VYTLPGKIKKINQINTIQAIGKRDKRFLSSRDAGVDGKFLVCAKILTGYEKSGGRS